MRAADLTPAQVAVARRVRAGALGARYGTDSPQVRSALDRWHRIDRARADTDRDAVLDTIREDR